MWYNNKIQYLERCTIMIKISRTGIRNLASNDIVYARGVQYYKDNRIVSATYSKTSKTYRLIIKGSYNYSVIVEEQDDGTFDYNCNCPSRLKDQGACKHVVTALLFILKYQERSMLSDKKPEEIKTLQIIDYFAAQEYSMLVGETFQLAPTVYIPTMLKGDNGRAMVSLSGGNNRMYKIQTIKKFLSDIYNQESFAIGKYFKFVAGESAFDSKSMNILNYLLQIYEIHELIDNSHFSKIFTKSQVTLTRQMLIKFLNVLDDLSFTLELYGKVYENVKFIKGNPKISYQLSIDEDMVIVDYKEKEAVIPITETGELLYFDGAIYQPDKLFIKNYKPFYNSFGKEKEPLVFKGDSKIKFLELVLPKISETMVLDIPDELQDRYITCDLETKIYFDKFKSGIKAELRFKYGEYEFNSFENASSGSYIIVRQRTSEDEVISELLRLGFQPYKNFYLMKDEDKIYELVSGKVMDLETMASLYYSEDFRKINVRQPSGFKAGVSINSELNMLELDLNLDGIPKEELKALYYSYKVKKKYYRLKDGSFINLENELINDISKILEAINVDDDNLQEDTILLSKQHAVYLDKIFSDDRYEFEKSIDFSTLTERILNPQISEYQIPERVEAELRPYQMTGYRWLRTLAENTLGGILADDMGLGKTLQSIVYIASIIEDYKKNNKLKPGERVPFLIVCPTSLIYNWLDEFENFTPFIKAEVVTGTPQERQDVIERYDEFDVLITSYPLIRRDITLYEQIEFNTVFIDEAQYIKNDASQNSKSVKRIRAKNHFALTGTPIENNLSELWSIFDFILPGYLGTHSKFLEVYEKPILRDDTEALNDLHQRIAPFILRRMKKDVLTELPDKYESKMLTELTSEQKKVYLSYLENIRNEIHTGYSEDNRANNSIKILAALTRLRQICCHPSTFIENYQGGSGKLELLMEVITDCIANDHRILVFSQFTSMLQIIEKELIELEIPYFYLVGSTSTMERNDYVKRFNNGEGKVFLISLKAGGTGLNLTGADTVIHYDPWWNPAVEDQATDRAYRIGQQNKVHVMKLITKGTIEEKIYRLQRKKKELSETVINTKEVFINTLSREELEDLFSPME